MAVRICSRCFTASAAVDLRNSSALITGGFMRYLLYSSCVSSLLLQLLLLHMLAAIDRDVRSGDEGGFV